MLITIDLEGDMPIYMQLRNQVILGIAKKELSPGESLPSVRQLAQDLGINMHTVGKAYGILKADGYIVIHKKKGVVVRRHADMKADAAFYEKLADELEPILAEIVCRGIKEQQFAAISRRILKNIQGR